MSRNDTQIETEAGNNSATKFNPQNEAFKVQATGRLALYYWQLTD